MVRYWRWTMLYICCGTYGHMINIIEDNQVEEFQPNAIEKQNKM